MSVMTNTGLEILQALDFDPEHECERSNHGKTFWHTGPAKYLVRVLGSQCPECERKDTPHSFLLCASAWEYAGKTGLACSGQRCEAMLPRDNHWTIQAVL